MTHHLLGSGADSAGVAVVEALVGALEGVVLRTVFAKVVGSVWSFRIYSVSEGTTRACDLLRVSLSAVQSAVSGRRWFGFYFAFGRRIFSDYRGYLRSAPAVF